MEARNTDRAPWTTPHLRRTDLASTAWGEGFGEDYETGPVSPIN